MEDGYHAWVFPPQFRTNTTDMGGIMRMGYHTWYFLHKYRWYWQTILPKIAVLSRRVLNCATEHWKVFYPWPIGHGLFWQGCLSSSEGFNWLHKMFAEGNFKKVCLDICARYHLLNLLNFTKWLLINRCGYLYFLKLLWRLYRYQILQD